MNGEGGNFAERSTCIPILRQKLITLFDDNFAGNRQIPVKPRPPEAAPIRHDVKLIAVELVDLAPRCDLQPWTVSMAANDLESLNRQILALVSCEECDDRRCISCEEVPLAFLEVPLLSLLDLYEAFLS